MKLWSGRDSSIPLFLKDPLAKSHRGKVQQASGISQINHTEKEEGSFMNS